MNNISNKKTFWVDSIDKACKFVYMCSAFDSDLTFETAVDLLLDPIATFRLISLNIDIIDHCANFAESIQVCEQLLHIIGHLLLVTVLES